MQKTKIVSRWNSSKVLLCGRYESVKDCLEKNRGAYLYGANLRGANLRGAKNYHMSYDFAMEIIRQQSIKYFISKEWATIGQMAIHRPCWDKIRKDYKAVLPVLKKLAKLGWGEYLKVYKEKAYD